LRERGYKIAIGSSSKNTPIILERIGLSGYFDAVADGNGIKNSKPDPEVFLLAAGKLGVPPAGCLVVEDAEAGIIAAKRGGMAAAAIGEARSCHEADYSLTKIEDLLLIV
ncbi:HAD-IA family hydrolase, partial [Paenibacillus macerans]